MPDPTGLNPIIIAGATRAPVAEVPADLPGEGFARAMSVQNIYEQGQAIRAARVKAAQDAIAQKEASAHVAQVLQSSIMKDPETGHLTYNRDTLMAGLGGAITPDIQKLLDASDASTKAFKQAHAAALTDMAGLVDKAGNTPEVFASELARAVGNGLITEPEAAQYSQYAKQNGVAALTAHVLNKPPDKPEPPKVVGKSLVGADGKVLYTEPDTAPPAARPVAVAPGHSLVDPTTGKVVYKAPAESPADTGQAPAASPAGPHGDEYLKTLPEADQNMVKALAEGRQPWPASFALKTPYWANLINKVFQYDPSMDTAAINNNARAKVRQDFTSGKSAQQVNAINTAIGHLDALSVAAKNLNNTSMTGWNAIKNWYQDVTGNAAPKTFEATREAVADELTRVWRQAGGSETDIQERKKSLATSSSPEQFRAVIAQIGDLIESKLVSSQEQLLQGMGIKDIHVLTPKSREVLNRLESGSATAIPANVQAALKGQPAGKHTLSDGSVWLIDAKGNITKGGG